MYLPQEKKLFFPRENYGTGIFRVVFKRHKPMYQSIGCIPRFPPKYHHSFFKLRSMYGTLQSPASANSPQTVLSFRNPAITQNKPMVKIGKKVMTICILMGKKQRKGGFLPIHPKEKNNCIRSDTYRKFPLRPGNGYKWRLPRFVKSKIEISSSLRRCLLP